MPKKRIVAVPGFDGPRKTAFESIRLFCIGCMGGSFALVTDCQSTDCAFHSYRSGTIEAGASRRLLRVIRSYCDGCALCVDVCPYHAITLVERAGEDDRAKGRLISVNKAKCKGCGLCQGTCPKRGVAVSGFTMRQISAQIQAALAV